MCWCAPCGSDEAKKLIEKLGDPSNPKVNKLPADKYYIQCRYCKGTARNYITEVEQKYFEAVADLGKCTSAAVAKHLKTTERKASTYLYSLAGGGFLRYCNSIFQVDWERVRREEP
jgi:hypothetical protein